MSKWIFGADTKEEKKSYAMSYDLRKDGPHGDPAMVVVEHKDLTKEQKAEYLKLAQEVQTLKEELSQDEEVKKKAGNADKGLSSSEVLKKEANIISLLKDMKKIKSEARGSTVSSQKNASKFMKGFGVFNTGPHKNMKSGKKRDVSLDENELAKKTLDAEKKEPKVVGRSLGV